MSHPTRPATPLPDDEAVASESSRSSVERIFDILGLFTIEQPIVQLDDVRERLGTAKSTTFRYFKTLADAGLLSPLGGGAYSIGPRVVELERLVRLTDPLLHAGEAVMAQAAVCVPNSILLLSALYKDKALCIHRAGPGTIKSDGADIDLVRSRGVPLPLFQGVASLAILAFLAPQRIKSIYLNFANSVAQCGLGATWPEFRANLTRYRKDGYVVTVGQYNKHLAGLAVPVFDPAQRVIGSLSRIMARDAFIAADVAELATNLQSASRDLTTTLATKLPPPTLPQDQGPIA